MTTLRTRHLLSAAGPAAEAKAEYLLRVLLDSLQLRTVQRLGAENDDAPRARLVRGGSHAERRQ